VEIYILRAHKRQEIWEKFLDGQNSHPCSLVESALLEIHAKRIASWFLIQALIPYLQIYARLNNFTEINLKDWKVKQDLGESQVSWTKSKRCLIHEAPFTNTISQQLIQQTWRTQPSTWRIPAQLEVTAKVDSYPTRILNWNKTLLPIIKWSLNL
jgi:hypothetical protein